MKISLTPNLSRWLTLIIVITGSFMSIIDLTIINVTMPSITTYFKDGLHKSEWLISGYALSISIMLLCSGWLARKYGYKTVYVTGLLTFTISSFLCSIAPSMNFLISMRVLQGVGSGIILPLSMSIIAHSFTGKERGLAMGLLIMVAGMAVSLGPFLGGYFVEIDKWDWVFKINIPTGVIAIIMTLFIIKNYRDNKTPKLDYIGVILLLIWAPLSVYILSSHFEWYLLVIFIIALTLFVLRMIYARNPLIDIGIFKNRNFVLAMIVMSCFGITLQGGSYILSEYLLHGLHYSAYAVGIMFVPVGIIQGAMAPIVGTLSHKHGNRIFILLGLFVILIYLYLSSLLTLESDYWFILLTLYLRGLGIGLSYTAITNLSFDGAKTTEIDSISGVINMTKQLAGSFSIAIATYIIVGKTNQHGITEAEGYALSNDADFMTLAVIITIAIIAALVIKPKKAELEN